MHVKIKLHAILARLKPRGTKANHPQEFTDFCDHYDDDTWKIIIDPQHDTYGSRSCRDRELWHARQAFLTSYHFSVVHDGSGQMRRKLRRWMKESRVVVVRVGSRFGQRIRDRWVGFKTTKVGLFRGAAMSLVRCFGPS